MTFTPAANSIRWLSVRNDSGEPVPPFAVLRPIGVVTIEGQAVLSVDKPNSDGGSIYLFNGPFVIAAGGFGSCTADFPCFAAYQTADTPVTGQQWGAQNGQWALKKGKTGYTIVGGAVDGRVEVFPTQAPSNLVRFYLNADLARGGSQSAQVLVWSGTLWLPGADTIEVFDSSKIGPATATEVGVCYLAPESNRYEIITLEQSATQLLLFHLLADIPLFGSAGAQPRKWDPGTTTWIDDPDADPITVFDSSGLGMAKEGDFGVAWLNPASGRYEIVTMAADSLVEFELYDTTLAKGGTANASLLSFDGTSWISSGTPDFVVDDSMLKLGPATKPARGAALHLNIAGLCNTYYVLVIDEDKAGLKRFYLNADLTQGGSASAQNMAWSGTAWLPDSNPAITVYDPDQLGPAPATHAGWYVTSSNGRNEIVLLDGGGHLLGKNLTGSPITQGSSGNITVYFGSPGGESSLGFTVNALAKFATVQNGDWVWLNWNGDGWYVMPGAGNQPQWAVATANWSNASGNNSTVACNLASDSDGTLLLDGMGDPIPVTVYLPRAGFGDPNVRAGDVIGFQVFPDGRAVCITDYMDDKIGTVKMWNQDESLVGRGWRIYSPSPGRFPVGVTSSDPNIPATTPGATGGQDTHFHDYRTPALQDDPVTLTIPPHTGYETSFTAIAVLPHDSFYTNATDLSASISGSGSVTISGGLTGPPTTNPSITISGNATSHSPAGTGTINTGDTIVTIPIHVPAVPFFIVGGGTGGPYYGLGSVSGSSYDTTENDGGHHHTVSVSAIAADLVYTTNDFAGDLSATLPDHVHEITGLTGTVSGVSVEITPNPHDHYVPSLVHIVDPETHNHAIPEMDHYLTPNPHRHYLPNSPVEKHIPPFFGIYFIERFE